MKTFPSYTGINHSTIKHPYVQTHLHFFCTATLKVTAAVRNKRNLIYTNIYFGAKYKSNIENNQKIVLHVTGKMIRFHMIVLPGQIAFHNVDSCKSLNYQHF